jgi:hypothetical protein
MPTRAFALLLAIAVLATACTDENDLPPSSDAAALAANPPGGGTQKVACASGMACPGGMVCLSGYCDAEPRGPCDGNASCGPKYMCLQNLKSYCPACVNTSGCIPTPTDAQ